MSCRVNQSSKKVSNGITCLSLTTFEAWNNRCFAQHFCLSSLLLHGLSSSAKASSIWFSLNVKGHCQARWRQIDLTMGIVTPKSFCSERYVITLSSSISRISRYGCFSFDSLHWNFLIEDGVCQDKIDRKWSLFPHDNLVGFFSKACSCHRVFDTILEVNWEFLFALFCLTCFSQIPPNGFPSRQCDLIRFKYNTSVWRSNPKTKMILLLVFSSIRIQLNN